MKETHDNYKTNILKEEQMLDFYADLLKIFCGTLNFLLVNLFFQRIAQFCKI